MTDLAQDRLERRGADPGITSLSLLERCRASDEHAWERLAHLYYPLMYGWCRRLGLLPQDAGDVCQAVFVTLASNLSRFRSESRKNSFRGWLWGITQNHLRCHHRQQNRFPRAIPDSVLEQKLIESPDEDQLQGIPSDEAEDRALVLDQVLELVRAEFEDRTWRAFWRAAVGGEPAADIAADLEITVNAVYLAKSRLLRRLRVELAGLIEL